MDYLKDLMSKWRAGELDANAVYPFYINEEFAKANNVHWIYGSEIAKHVQVQDGWEKGLVAYIFKHYTDEQTGK